MSPITVTIAAGVLLILGALFAAGTWPALFRRVAKDPRARDANGALTPFYKVHRLLVTVALTLAGFSLIAGVLVFAVVLPEVVG